MSKRISLPVMTVDVSLVYNMNHPSRNIGSFNHLFILFYDVTSKMRVLELIADEFELGVGSSSTPGS